MLNYLRAVRRTFELLRRPERRWRWLALVGVAVMATGFEAVGALLIYALLGLMASGTGEIVLPVVGDVSGWLPGMSLRTLQLTSAALVAGFFVVRAGVAVGQVYLQARLVHNAGARLSADLLRGYLALPYHTHTQLNSAELVRNAFDSVQALELNVMKPAVEVAAQLIMVAGLTALLFVIAPVGALLALAVLLPAVIVLQTIVQPRLKRFGRKAQASRRGALKAMEQALGGVRDIRLLRREESFSDEFAVQRRVMARADYMNATLSQVPRRIIESVIVMSIIVVFVFAAVTGQDMDRVAATLGVFAYAGLRLQPSLRQIVQGLNHIRFGMAVVDDLLEDRERCDPALAAQQARRKEPIRGRKMEHSIRLQDVSFTYAPGAPPALDHVDLLIRKGEFVGICGPTGGGKSTLVDVIAGLLRPTTGQVLIDGQPLGGHPTWWFSELGMVSQSVYLIDDTIRRNIAFGLPEEEVDEELLHRCIERAQLQDVIADLPLGVSTVVGDRGVRLSGGQRQRVAVARALYREPSVIVFDEGTAALDMATEAALVAAIDELKAGRTLISVAHRISTVRQADRIIVVQGGRLVQEGSHARLLDESELFRTLAQ